MLRKSKRVCFSPDSSEKPTMFLKHSGGGDPNSDSGGGGGGRVVGKRKRIIRSWTLKFPKESRMSPVRFLLRLGAKVASAIGGFSARRRSSTKVSSSALVRSRSLSDPIDSHRAKAVEDCIEFLHSSSSRERPSSASEISG